MTHGGARTRRKKSLLRVSARERMEESDGEGEIERKTETKNEVRARVVFERDTVASHREETVAGLPQGCLHRRGESYTKRGPHPIFRPSSCFVSFFFSFDFLIIRCFVPRHLARRDRLIETTDVDRLSRDFASKRATDYAERLTKAL